MAIALRLILTILAAMLVACSDTNTQKQDTSRSQATVDTMSLLFSSEGRHLANVRQLTFGRENAEAYFSYNGDEIIFQATRDTFQCDQIFTMNADGSDITLVSTGKGRTTCAFIQPDGKKIIYSSTHLSSHDCPPPADMSKGYVWALYPGFDIFQADLDGANLVNLTNSPRYDAEAVYSPNGSMIAFTSLRSGDLEIYTMKPDGSDVRRLTDSPGYDGGPFFSRDSKRIVYRASRPETDAEIEDYRNLLDQDMIRPGKLEIFVMDADGSNRRQITNNGAANFAPYFHPDGKRIIFCSNLADTVAPRRNFDLFMVNDDGSGLERITYNSTFDGFPMFSHDGKKLLFCSNRHNDKPGETNVFMADWID